MHGKKGWGGRLTSAEEEVSAIKANHQSAEQGWVHKLLFSGMFHRFSLKIRPVGYTELIIDNCSTEFLFSCGTFLYFFVSVPNAARFAKNSVELFARKPLVYPTQPSSQRILWNFSPENL